MCHMPITHHHVRRLTVIKTRALISSYLQREHSLSRPYSTISGFGAGSSYWDFGGNAMITGNHVRLTSEKPGETGYLWNK